MIVVRAFRMAPRVAPLIPDKSLTSVDSIETRAPEEFSGRSKKAMS
jgi:hypothetical protein